MHTLPAISFSDCAVAITQTSGVIASPGFPKSYRNGIECTWNIQMPIGQLIHFNFLHFDLQYGFLCGWDISVFWHFLHPLLIVNIYFPDNFFLISGMIHWQFMMEAQIHQRCWEIHIVMIPCHPAKFLQVTNSSFIFNQIILTLVLDSNWNIMQQVKIP